MPFSRRPNFIHVAGKYLIVKITKGMLPSNEDGSESNAKENTFWVSANRPDVQAIAWTIDALQSKAMQTNHIAFDYSEIVQNLAEAVKLEGPTPS